MRRALGREQIMAEAKKLVPFILHREGGFSNDPRDSGGATNKGVTLKTFRQFFGHEKTVKDLRKITDEQWLHIFRTGYWERWRADEIGDQSVAEMLVDWVWCSGVHGIKNPQRVLGVTADGIVGPLTIGAVNRHPSQKQLFELLKRSRLDFIDRICRSDPRKECFRRGWTNRIDALNYFDRQSY